MEIASLSEISKPNDLPHGGKHCFMYHCATRQQRNVLNDLTMETHDRDHHRLRKELQDKVWRIHQGTQKLFPRNSTKSRTEPAICLGPTGNLQGSYWFLNLHTGRRIKRRKFTPLAVPTRVIDRVHELSEADDRNPAIDFFDHLGNPIEDGDTSNDDNKDDDGGLAGVENNKNKDEGEKSQEWTTKNKFQEGKH